MRQPGKSALALQQIGTLVGTGSPVFCVLWPFMTASVLHLVHPSTLRVLFVLRALCNEGVMDSNGRRPDPRALSSLITHAFHNRARLCIYPERLKNWRELFAKA